MRIAYFVNDFPVVSQIFILNQITGMIDSGEDVQIFAFRNNQLDTIHEVIYEYELLDKVQYLNSLPSGKITAVLHIVKQIIRKRLFLAPSLILKAMAVSRDNNSNRSLLVLNDILQFEPANFDIIHCQFGVIAPRVLNLLETEVLKGNLVTSFRGYDATKYAARYPKIYLNLFKKGVGFLPVSQSIRSNLTDLGCPENKITILHSGLDLEKFQFQCRTYSKNSVVKVITIARLVDKKGISYCLSAIAKAIAAGHDIHYSIVGEGPLETELKKYTNHLGIGDNVKFHGYKVHSEVVELLNKSHILVAPSITAADGDQEGIPNVMKEAMAVGLPVIGTRHGGIPELVEHGKSGFLVGERDDQAISDVLIKLCEQPDIWEEMCFESRRVIEEEFDIIKLNKQLKRVYQSFMSDPQ